MASINASKGVALPVNTVIIIIVAVLVLGTIVLFFTSYSGAGTTMMSHASAWSDGCMKAKLRGCMVADFETSGSSIQGYDPNGDSTPETVLSACKNFFSDQGLGAAACRAKCCGGSAPAATSVPPTATPVPDAPPVCDPGFEIC